MSLRSEIKNIMQRDPAARNVFEVLLYPSLHALLFHRLAHRLYQAKVPFFPRLISQFSRFLTQIEIHPGAKIGQNFFIDHGSGVVIGETAEIGDNVTLYQGVTLGGTGKERGKRHPTIGNNVLVGVGAKVLGAITVGDNARIGGGAVVLKDVPPGATAVGVPAKIVGTRLDQTQSNQRVESLPDPEGDLLNALQIKSRDLEEKISNLVRNQLQAHIDETREVENNHVTANQLEERLALLEERLAYLEQILETNLALPKVPPAGLSAGLGNGISASNGHK